MVTPLVKIWRFGLTAMMAGLFFICLPHYECKADDVSVSPTGIVLTLGQALPVTIIADSSSNLFSVQLTVTYDPTVLNISSITNVGTVLGNWTMVNNTNTPGKAVIGLYSTTSISPFTGQPIVVVNFNVNNQAALSSTAVNISQVSFNASSVTTITNGSYTLNIPPVYYNLNINPAGNGNVTWTVNNQPSILTSFLSGTQVVLTASPSGGYQFGTWSGDISGSINPITVVMDGNKTISANFIVNNGSPPVITTQPVSEAVTPPAPAIFTVAGTGVTNYQWQISYNYGVTFSDIPGATNASYTTPATTSADDWSQFRCVLSNSSGTTISNKVTLTLNTTVQVTISASPVAGGSVSCNGGSCVTQEAVEAIVTYTAQSNPGYSLSGWSVSGATPSADCAGTTGTCTVTVYATTSVTANFTGGPPQFGEVLSGDTGVTAADAAATLSIAVGKSVVNFITANAMVDGTAGYNGKPTVYDAELILQYSLKEITSFPAAQQGKITKVSTSVSRKARF